VQESAYKSNSHARRFAKSEKLDTMEADRVARLLSGLIQVVSTALGHDIVRTTFTLILSRS